MPKRVIKYSREDPARTILAVTCFMSLVAQAWAMTLTVPWYHAFPNFLIVAPFAAYGLIGSSRGNLKHMAWSSFGMFLIWTWTGITRLIVVEGIGELLWMPFLMVGFTMGICYLHFSFKRRVGDLD